MIDIVEILVHWYAGRSQHELAASLGVDRKTIRKYTAPAVAAGLVPRSFTILKCRNGIELDRLMCDDFGVRA